MANIIRPSLPTYSQDEVSCFHPVFEYASLHALSNLGLQDDFRLTHHKSIGNITVDFAFERIITNRIFLLAEIKRTQSDVQSTRFRNQAKSYRTEADPIAETPYYLLSNLEIIDLFRYDRNRPRVASQLIEGSPFRSGILSDNNEDLFYENLINNLTQILSLCLNDSGNYQSGLSRLHTFLSQDFDNWHRWHQLLIPSSYEYIRGSSVHYDNIRLQIDSFWRAADSYRFNPARIIYNGSSLDFLNIFSDPLPPANDPEIFDVELLRESYQSGLLRANGEDITEVVSNVLSSNGRGVIETDDELARLLSVVAKDSLSRDLASDEIICDPGAGNGRLLTAAQYIFSNIRPNQIMAIEIEQYFQESLSIRLGLSHANTLGPQNFPIISINDLTYMSPEDFIGVRIILMNPPFLSGVSSRPEKDKFERAIERVSGRNSLVSRGQIGLEALYLEMVWHLVPPGTIIATVFPHRYLRGLSREICNFREFLVNNFGLSHIVTYPRYGLFDSVTKQTVIFVGEKGASITPVKLVDLQVDVERVDFSELQVGLNQVDLNPARGVLLSNVDREVLNTSVSENWYTVIGRGKKALNWIETHFSDFIPLADLTLELKRGTAGNSGFSDLIMFPPDSEIGSVLIPLIPDGWLRPGLRRSDSLPKILSNENYPCQSFLPPADSFEQDSANGVILDRIIHAYLTYASENPRSGSQRRQVTQNLDRVKQIIDREVTITPRNNIAIPRGTRRKGNIGFLNVDTIVSTNFVLAQFNNYLTSALISCWIFSIFGQLQLELHAIDQEGMRKLEKEQISKILIPDFTSFSEEDKNNLVAQFINSDSLDFQDLIIREIDEQWEDILNRYFNLGISVSDSSILLQEMVDDRRPAG